MIYLPPFAVHKIHIEWKHICANNEELIRICMQVKELINMRDRCMNGIFKREE